MDIRDVNWKRIGLVAGFIIVFILLCSAVYFVFFSQPLSTPLPEPRPIGEVHPLPGRPGEFEKNPPTPGSDTGMLPTTPVITKKTAAEPGDKPVEVTEIEAGDNRSPQLSADGSSIVTFNSNDGVFYRIAPDGTVEPMTDQTFKGAHTVAWDSVANKAAISFIDGTNIVYDFIHKKQYSLPKHWDDVQFSPSGDKLVFKNIAPDTENRWLAISDADGSNGKLIEHMNDRAEYFTPTWSPSDQIIGLYREGYDADRQKLYFIGLHGENFKSAVVPGRGLETAWSPKGEQLLLSSYSSSSDYKPELWIMDSLGESIGGNRRRLNINTWAHKCTFADTETLYCGIPTTLERGAGLIPSQGEDVPDEIYRIDLATGIKQKVADLPEDRTIGKLIVSQDQSILYFQERFTDKLFKIDLK